MTSGWDEITRGMSDDEWNILLRRAQERAYKGVIGQTINCTINKKGNIIQTLMHPDQYQTIFDTPEYKAKRKVYNQLAHEKFVCLSEYCNYEDCKKERERKNMNEKNKRFTNAGGKLPDTHKPEDKKLHFATILSNPDKYIWRASRNRNFFIQAKNPSGGASGVLEDKHLINVMRYLITNWKGMEEIIFFELKVFYNKFPGMKTVNVVQLYRSAPDMLENCLACWSTLVNETVERFGSDALLSLLDGN